MDLHIGVTTSTGAIVEFDRCGLRRRQEQLQRHPDNTVTTKLTPPPPPQSTLHQSSMKNSNSNSKVTSDSGMSESGRPTNDADNIPSGGGGSKWNQSLLVEQVPEEWCEHWDTVLEEVS